jgi:hypothetical protein
MQGARRGLREPLVNYLLIIRAIFYRHRKYQIIQATQKYQNIDVSIRPCIDTSCSSLFLYAKTKTKKLAGARPLLANWQRTLGLMACSHPLLLDAAANMMKPNQNVTKRNKSWKLCSSRIFIRL